MLAPKRVSSIWVEPTFNLRGAQAIEQIPTERWWEDLKFELDDLEAQG